MPIFKAISKKRGVRPRHPLFTVLPVLGLFFLLGLILWYSYPDETSDESAVAVPIIRADATPYKVIPSDPGGMDIPYRDSTVFETLRASRLEDESAPRVESLLPPENEEPVDRTALFAGLKTDMAQNNDLDDGPDETVTETAQTDKSSVLDTEDDLNASIAKADKTEKTTPDSVVDDRAAARTAPGVKPPQEIETAAKPVGEPADDAANGAAATEPAAGEATKRITEIRDYQSDPQGTHYIQLGSFRSHADAETGWRGTQKQFPSLLKALELNVERADLGDRGVFYRMQAGPLDKQAASEICSRIKQDRPGGCLVVSR